MQRRLFCWLFCRSSCYMTMLLRLTSRCVFRPITLLPALTSPAQTGRKDLDVSHSTTLRPTWDLKPFYSSDYRGDCLNFSFWSIDISFLRCSCSSHRQYVLPILNQLIIFIGTGLMGSVSSTLLFVTGRLLTTYPAPAIPNLPRSVSSFQTLSWSQHLNVPLRCMFVFILVRKTSLNNA